MKTLLVLLITAISITAASLTYTATRAPSPYDINGNGINLGAAINDTLVELCNQDSDPGYKDFCIIKDLFIEAYKE